MWLVDNDCKLQVNEMLCASDVLATDKQLANEIEFDLRKFEEQEKEKQKQQRGRNVSVSRCRSSRNVHRQTRHLMSSLCFIVMLRCAVEFKQLVFGVL